jgi:L-ribulose-5-phosphate 3-epimerase
MRIGVMTGWGGERSNPFAHVGEFGLKCCQLANWDPAAWSKFDPKATRAQARAAGVDISCVWAGYPGPAVWNFVEGPATIGLVPEKWRAERVAALKKAADFTAKLGAPAIATHAGFLPESMSDPLYQPTLAALKDVAGHCRKVGIGFWFETGQETPVCLLRFIEEIGLDNLGINLDPANLILYGKGNPIDSLDVFGKYVRNIHAKDGLYPTTGRELGHEVAVGKGCVRFPEFIKKLHKIGFRGELIIEREISGAQQTKDIRKTVNDLKRWKARLR